MTAVITPHELVSIVFGTNEVVAGFDCTGVNEPLAPHGAQLAGYDTGSGGIPWTKNQYNAHPGAIHIDQDPAARDPLADVLDVENGAATFADCPGWSKRAWSCFNSVNRPGQRTPTIYMSASNVTNVVNALINGGVNKGVNLWVANWNLSEAQAVQDVINASGPFPIEGVQYGNGTWGDFDVWSTKWLHNVSGTPIAENPVRNLNIVGRGYTHLDASWDDETHATSYTVKAFWPATNGSLVREYTVDSPPVRIRNLLPVHTYEIQVRAHPGGSVGADATVHGTTR